MQDISGWYENSSKFYLREARICVKYRAYRMAIIAAFTSVHQAAYFILLHGKVYDQSDRADGFSNILGKMEHDGMYEDVVSDMKWLMNARNAVAHPDVWMTVEDRKDFSGTTTSTMKEKIKDLPDIKKHIYTASMLDKLDDLAKSSKDAVQRAERVLFLLGIAVEADPANECKHPVEEEMSRLLGIPVNLETIFKSKPDLK